jgi:hypothetical protein
MMTETLHNHLTILEQERCRCLIENDFDKLKNLLSKQLIHVHTKGHVDGLDGYLRFVQEVAQVVDLNRGALTVREIGDNAAVMLGRQTNHSRNRVNETLSVTQAQVVQLWVREQDGAWRISVFQGTAVPAEH